MLLSNQRSFYPSSPPPSLRPSFRLSSTTASSVRVPSSFSLSLIAYHRHLPSSFLITLLPRALSSSRFAQIRLNFREHPIAPRMQHPLRAPAFSHRGTRGFGKLTLYSRGIDWFNAVQIIGGQRVSLICFDEDICISITTNTTLHDD